MFFPFSPTECGRASASAWELVDGFPTSSTTKFMNDEGHDALQGTSTCGFSSCAFVSFVVN